MSSNPGHERGSYVVDLLIRGASASAAGAELERARGRFVAARAELKRARRRFLAANRRLRSAVQAELERSRRRILALEAELERAVREADETEIVVINNNTSTGMVSMSGFPAHSVPPPLSKASIDAAMPKFKLTGEKYNVGNSCAICLEEINVGGEVREMPCKHVFHCGCIDEWLGTSRSCPVCRYVMPVDEEEDVDGSDENGRRVRRRRRRRRRRRY